MGVDGQLQMLCYGWLSWGRLNLPDLLAKYVGLTSLVSEIGFTGSRRLDTRLGQSCADLWGLPSHWSQGGITP